MLDDSEDVGGNDMELCPTVHMGATQAQPQYPDLRQDLSPYAVLAIAYCTTAGLGISIKVGEALRVSGPAGCCIGFTITSTIAYAVMISNSRLTKRWPYTKPFTEVTETLTSRRLARTVGWAYWLAYTSCYGTVFNEFMNLIGFWTSSILFKFFFIIPPFWVLLWIGKVRVKVFGNLLLIFSFIKIISGMVVVIVMWAFILTAVKSSYIDDGIQSQNTKLSDGFARFTAISAIIPTLTYSFIGIETIPLIIAEAKNPKKAARWASDYIFLSILVTYFLLTTSFLPSVKWCDAGLPRPNGYRWSSEACHDPLNHQIKNGTRPNTNSIPVLFLQETLHPIWSDVANIWLIFQVFTVAAATLYISSRQLFNLMKRKTSETTSSAGLNPGKLNQYSTPEAAVKISSFVALVFAVIQGAAVKVNLSQISTAAACGSIVFVWACICLNAFNYHRNIIRFPKENLEEERPLSFSKRIYEMVLACYGFFGCILIMFAIPSLSFRYEYYDGISFGVAIGTPIILGTLTVFSPLCFPLQARTGENRLEKSLNIANRYHTLDNYNQPPIKAPLSDPPKDIESTAAKQD